MDDDAFNDGAVRIRMLQPITKMLLAALGPRIAPGVVDFLDLFAEDGILELPFDGSGPQRFEGRPAMERYLKSVDGSLVFEQFGVSGIYVADGDRVTLEYRGIVRDVATEIVHQKLYIAVVLRANGRIREFREYYDPLAIDHARETAEYIARTGGINPSADA